jgi:hypothetical protein
MNEMLVDERQLESNCDERENERKVEQVKRMKKENFQRDQPLDPKPL